MTELITQDTPNGGYETTNSVTLTRGQKGTYGWEIKVRWPMNSIDTDSHLDELQRIDVRLRATYPTAGE